MQAVRIGIIGGEGQMGRWLRRFWHDLGYEVIHSDLASTLRNEDVLAQAQVTFVAIPLAQTPALLRELAPLVPEHAALGSIASLMEPSAEALLSTPGETFCAHPVFGPSVSGVAGLPVVIAPIHGHMWQDWLAETLRSAGLSVRISTPYEHDAAMAVVQAMLHSLYVALGATMAGAGLAPTEALGWASPTLRLQLGLMARILGQDAELYADLVVGNTLAPRRLDELAEQLHRLANMARQGDRLGFAHTFRAVYESFGDDAGPLAARAEEALEGFI